MQKAGNFRVCVGYIRTHKKEQLSFKEGPQYRDGAFHGLFTSSGCDSIGHTESRPWQSACRDDRSIFC